MGTYKDLDIWKESMALVRTVYKTSNQLPDTQKYSLVSQMQRSAISIPSNIAEGSARHTDKETIQFLYIALGSIAELNTQLILVEDLGYAETQALQNDCDRIRKKILNLIKYLRTRPIQKKRPPIK